jgi:hypothetical protein
MPVLVAAKALLGVSIVIGVTIIVLGAVYHSMMTIVTTLVRPTRCGFTGLPSIACKHFASAVEVRQPACLDLLPVLAPCVCMSYDHVACTVLDMW